MMQISRNPYRGTWNPISWNIVLTYAGMGTTYFSYFVWRLELTSSAASLFSATNAVHAEITTTGKLSLH
jgi:hypothetical protein